MRACKRASFVGVSVSGVGRAIMKSYHQYDIHAAFERQCARSLGIGRRRFYNATRLYLICGDPAC